MKVARFAALLLLALAFTALTQKSFKVKHALTSIIQAALWGAVLLFWFQP